MHMYLLFNIVVDSLHFCANFTLLNDQLRSRQTHWIVHWSLSLRLLSRVLHGTSFPVPLPPVPASSCPAPVPVRRSSIPIRSRSREHRSRSHPDPATRRWALHVFFSNEVPLPQWLIAYKATVFNIASQLFNHAKLCSVISGIDGESGRRRRAYASDNLSRSRGRTAKRTPGPAVIIGFLF